MPVFRIIAAATLLASVAASSSLRQDQAVKLQNSSELLDYLVQDVCVDRFQRPIAGDPASCQASRNLRIGEALPYIVTDFDRAAGVSYASFSSIPVRGADGLLKILVVKSLEGRFTPDYQFSFSGARDAFDLIDTSHSQFASIVRTFDGGCHDQVFSRSGHSRKMAERAGGWVLFPLDSPPSAWAAATSLRVATWRSQVSVKRPQCADNHASGITYWNRPAPYTFEAGKRLTAIRSNHFAAANLAQGDNALERFYFTREYGMTRWESWRTRSACRASEGVASRRCRPDAAESPLRGRCSVLETVDEKGTGLETWGGQEWVRLDCRDLTRYVPLKRPQLPLSPAIARGGGLLDIDYSGTVGQ